MEDDDKLKISDKIEVREYSGYASLKGVCIDDTWVSMGWYVFESDGANVVVRGHQKPLVHSSRPECGEMLDFFRGHFDAVWKRSRPLDVKLAQEASSEEPNQASPKE